MNILFVIKRQIYSAVEPLGILSLASFLKKNGHQVFLADSSLAKISQIIKEKDIGVLAVSCMKTDYQDYLNLCRKIKRKFPKILIVWGGPTPTYNPEIITEKVIDIICRGEGELAFLELVDRLDRQQNINHIPNLWIKNDSIVYKNDVGPLIPDLDTLPFPDRSLTNNFPQFRYSPTKFVMAGRGCPFNCSFCYSHHFHQLYQGKGKLVRTRSVGNVLEELKELKTKQRAKFFYFLDDNFPSDNSWLAEFSEKYAYQIKVPFTIVTQATIFNEKMARFLSKAGCVSLHLAIECGNEKIRKKILNKNISNQQIIKAVKIAKKNGLAVCAYNMIGIPFSKFENELETLDFNLQAKVDNVYAAFCLPFPETKLGQMAKKAGLISEKTKFFSWFEKIPIKVKNKEKLEKFGHLFPIIILFPFLRRYLFILLKIPFPKLLLKLLKDIVNGYSFKKKIIPLKTSLTEFFVIMFSFLFKRFSK